MNGSWISVGEACAAVPAYSRCSLLLLAQTRRSRQSLQESVACVQASSHLARFRRSLCKLPTWKNQEVPHRNLATRGPPSFQATAGWSGEQRLSPGGGTCVPDSRDSPRSLSLQGRPASLSRMLCLAPADIHVGERALEPGTHLHLNCIIAIYDPCTSPLRASVSLSVKWVSHPHLKENERSVYTTPNRTGQREWILNKRGDAVAEVWLSSFLIGPVWCAPHGVKLSPKSRRLRGQCRPRGSQGLSCSPVGVWWPIGQRGNVAGAAARGALEEAASVQRGTPPENPPRPEAGLLEGKTGAGAPTPSSPL